MSDPIRLKCLKGVTSALERINPANGFAADLRGAVFRGRVFFGSDDPIPMIALFEPPVTEPRDQGGKQGTVSTGPWALIIQGFVKDDKLNPLDPAYELAADVLTVLAEERARTKADGRTADMFGMGGFIQKMTIGNPIVRPSDEISPTAYFWITLDLTVIEDLAKPRG